MINRRDFILTGTFAALPFTACGARPVGLPGAKAAEPAAPIYTMVYDERFADSVAFAGEARRLGLRATGIHGDVTALWYDDLYHRWRQGPAAIAGLTTANALFCLETLGNDVGLRRVLKAEHRGQPGRLDIEHRLEGPAALLRSHALEDSGPLWARRMAHLAVRCPATREGRVDGRAVSIGSSPQAADHPVLVSWVLAPTRRASLQPGQSQGRLDSAAAVIFPLECEARESVPEIQSYRTLRA
jgi:hypothetical protein